MINICQMCSHPNKPLLLGELLNMEGKPVWLEIGEVSIQEAIVGYWEILERVAIYPVKGFWFTRRKKEFTEINYGKTWLAYRHKP